LQDGFWQHRTGRHALLGAFYIFENLLYLCPSDVAKGGHYHTRIVNESKSLLISSI
jgi:hypothetical protein